MKANRVAQLTGCDVMNADELVWRRAVTELCLSLHSIVGMLADCVERKTPYPFAARNELYAADVYMQALLDGMDAVEEPGERPVRVKGNASAMARWEAKHRLVKPCVDDAWATETELDEAAEAEADYNVLVAETVCRQMGVDPESLPEFTHVEYGGEA